MTRRADVVIARFPYAGRTGAKVRPAVVVQCDRLNKQIHNTLLAMITGNTSLIGVEPTQFLIDPSTAEGASSGLSYPSAVKCENLATIPQTDILDTIGSLSDALKQ
jgi:mRNA interferase MazF